jgi:hypothetical protein
MQPKQEFSALQQRIEVHNELAAKYAHQVAQLRHGISGQAEGWEALLSHLMGHCLVEGESEAEFDEETLTALIDFGFQCMGIGAVVAMDGLAQERIVI